MGKASKLMRSSINAFLQSYHSFTSIATLFVLPVSASVLLSQPLLPSSPALRTISSRFRSLFRVAGCPVTSPFFSLLSLKISQTIFSFVVTLPFTLTFLILAKASVVQTIRELPRSRRAPPFPSSFFPRLYRSVLRTHLFNSFVILSANATIFSIVFIAFNLVDVLRLSSSGSSLVLSAAAAILYSVVLANITVTCNLAIVVSAMNNTGGYLPVVKACALIRGRAARALTLALPANLGMAAMEALFQHRVMKAYRLYDKFNPSIVLEGFTIVYVHSLLTVLDTIMSCKFFESCESGCDHRTETALEPEEKVGQQV